MPVSAALTAPSHLGGGQPSRGAEAPPAQPCWGPAAPQQSWLGCHPLLLVCLVPRPGLAAPGPSSSPSPSSSSSRDPLHSPPGQGEEGMRRRRWQPPPAWPTPAVTGGALTLGRRRRAARCSPIFPTPSWLSGASLVGREHSPRAVRGLGSAIGERVAGSNEERSAAARRSQRSPCRVLRAGPAAAHGSWGWGSSVSP